MTGDGTQPEVQAGVFVAEPNVPKKQIYGSIREEKLRHDKNFDQIDEDQRNQQDHTSTLSE